MLVGASLSEIWGEDYNKSSTAKTKKKKKKKSTPLTPNEMDSELLIHDEDKRKFNTNEHQRVESLKEEYDEIRIPRFSNVVTERYPYGRTPSRIEEDPDYLEFMEYKKMKRTKQTNPKESFGSNIVSFRNENNQFNELLLYIFTGFFLLLLYDNIYKFGKNSY
tara:strand:- start:715 stop:1203 length:489 start_codon:yes stop_codon:yes gene_type:complete